jgi:hypothetical protein
MYQRGSKRYKERIPYGGSSKFVFFDIAMVNKSGNMRWV